MIILSDRFATIISKIKKTDQKLFLIATKGFKKQ